MIKYRVYDKKRNKYLPADTAYISGNGTLTVVGIESKCHMSVQPPNEKSPRFIIEQYTGLKDKNGVEIAVGDILGLYEIYIEEDETESEELELWGEVVRTAAAVSVKSVRTGTFNDIIFDEEDFSKPMTGVEIIGNIHENAELLEEK